MNRHISIADNLSKCMCDTLEHTCGRCRRTNGVAKAFVNPKNSVRAGCVARQNGVGYVISGIYFDSLYY